MASVHIRNIHKHFGGTHVIRGVNVDGVVFGGVGNLWGPFVGALSLGLVNKFLEPYAGAVLGKILVLVGLFADPNMIVYLGLGKNPDIVTSGLLYENPKDKGQAKIMVDFVKWALTEGQKFAPDLGYAPLPQEVVALEMQALNRIRT